MTMVGHVTHQPIAALKDGLVKLTEPGATKPQWSFSSGERATAGYLASNNYDTHTQPFNSLLSGTTWVGRYQKKHSLTHTHPDHRTSFIILLHLQRSMAYSLFILRAWQSSRTTSLHVLFGLPLVLWPSTSYSMHFFTQSSSSVRSTYPYQRSLFCCNTNVMSVSYTHLTLPTILRV